MANINNPHSFEVLDVGEAECREFPVEASYAGKKGDVCYLNSAGRVTATPGRVLGIQGDSILDETTNGATTVAVGSEDDKVKVFCSPYLEFAGQISVGALADTYTTSSSAACFDVAGSAGQQYVDAGSSTYDVIKVGPPYTEVRDGSTSAVGAYQKKIFRFNLLKHVFGTIA